MKQTPLEQKIADITAPVIQDHGLAPFCVKVNGTDGAQTVQIMAEDPATKRLGIDDCTKLSKAISAILDVEDPIKGAYRLEVSSPGIDRLLLKAEDFKTYQGFDVKVESNVPAENGQRKFRGTIERVDDESFEIKTDQGVVEISFDSVTKAKLVMSDALIKATANLNEED